MSDEKPMGQVIQIDEAGMQSIFFKRFIARERCSCMCGLSARLHRWPR